MPKKLRHFFRKDLATRWLHNPCSNQSLIAAHPAHSCTKVQHAVTLLQHIQQRKATHHSYPTADLLAKGEILPFEKQKLNLAPHWIFNIHSHLFAVGVRFQRLWDNE